MKAFGVLALAFLCSWTAEGAIRRTEIICGQESEVESVVDLSEDRRLYWIRHDNSATDCEVTFKLPPRQNFKIWMEDFYLDGDFKKGQCIKMIQLLNLHFFNIAFLS